MTGKAARESLLARRAQFQDTFSTGDIHAIGRLLDDNVMWILPSGPPWVGAGTVIHRLGEFFERFAYVFRLGRPYVDLGDAWATDRSSFTSHLTDHTSGEETVHDGACLMVWHLVDDWRIALYADTGTRPGD